MHQLISADHPNRPLHSLPFLGGELSDKRFDGLTMGRDEVLAALPETILQVDRDLRVLAVNRPDSPIFERVPVLDEPLAKALDVDAAGLMAGAVESALQSGLAEGEYHTDRGLYRFTVQPLKSAPVILIVFRDVTGRRKTEQALMETMRGKSNVLASVGNELQAPLNSVIAYASLLAKPESEIDEPYRQALVEHMAGQAWDLAGMIDDLLAVAHTEIGDLHVARVPASLFANTAQVLESMGERGTRITVTGDRSTTAVGDPARLRQIVRNLLGNALTHGSEPITIDVSASNGRAFLRVKDRGPGVTTEVESQGLFTHPIEDPTNSSRVGIGLWVSNELAELMGGHLDYRREYGLTVFEVSLPMLAPDQPPHG